MLIRKSFDTALLDYLRENKGSPRNTHYVSVQVNGRNQYLHYITDMSVGRIAVSDDMIPDGHRITDKEEIYGDDRLSLSVFTQYSAFSAFLKTDAKGPIELIFDRNKQTLTLVKTYQDGSQQFLDITQIRDGIEKVATEPIRPDPSIQGPIEISIEKFTQEIYANRKDRSQTFDDVLTDYLRANPGSTGSNGKHFISMEVNGRTQYLSVGPAQHIIVSDSMSNDRIMEGGRRYITPEEIYGNQRFFFSVFRQPVPTGQTLPVQVKSMELIFDEATQTLSGLKTYDDGRQELVEITRLKEEVKPIQPTQPTQPTQPGGSVSQGTLDLLKQYGVDLSNPNWMDDIIKQNQPTQPGGSVSHGTRDLLKQHGVDISNPNWMDNIIKQNQPTQPGGPASQGTRDLLKQHGIDISNPNWMDDIIK